MEMEEINSFLKLKNFSVASCSNHYLAQGIFLPFKSSMKIFRPPQGLRAHLGGGMGRS